MKSGSATSRRSWESVGDFSVLFDGLAKQRPSTDGWITALWADEHFTRLVVEPKHVRMAAEFLCRLYSNENCALDDYSQIARYGSQLLDYDQIEQDFMDKWEHEKHAHGEDKGFFSRLIFILHITRAIRREDLAEQVGCSVETVKRIVRLLKRFNLLDTTRDGYVKKPKFNKFLRRFSREHRDFSSRRRRVGRGATSEYS